MAAKTTKKYNVAGDMTSGSVDSDKSDADLADSAAKEKFTDTKGLGSYKPKAVVEETDPAKMSPMARAAYETKKKRKGPTTDDAAAALGARR